MGPKVKVLHVISQLGVGGAERMLFNLVCEGQQSIWDCVVISLTDEGHYGPLLRKRGIPVIAIGGMKNLLNPMKWIPLLRQLRKEKFFIIQSWLYHADLLSIFLSVSLRTPLIWNLRCSNVDWKSYSPVTGHLIRLLALLSKFPSAVIVNSEAGKKAHMRMGYVPRKWALIPNGFDTHRFQDNPSCHQQIRQKLGVPHDTQLVGIVGKWDPLKDYSTFFQAARQLLKTQPKTHFVMWGNGLTESNPELTDALKITGHPKKFHLLGLEPHLESWLPGLTLFTLSSRTEGFPNVIGEAMSCGVPCVSTDAGAASEILGKNGIVVGTGNASQLALAWKNILTLKETEYNAMRLASRESILKRFSLTSVLSTYHNLYLSVSPVSKLASLKTCDVQ